MGTPAVASAASTGWIFLIFQTVFCATAATIEILAGSIVVCKLPVSLVVSTAKQALYTDHIGDGKIFIHDVENVIKVRTGEESYDALQDDVG